MLVKMHGSPGDPSVTLGVMSPQTAKALLAAYQSLVDDWTAAGRIDAHHVKDTPMRVVKAMQELFGGLAQEPSQYLSRQFEEGQYDQMVIVRDISFVSMCAHHLLPFSGTVHFGYLPNLAVVGLSKIPRMIEAFARRPQTQEVLSRQIVDTFQKHVEPLGCGVVIDAHHSCMSLRGVRKDGARMRTIALAGNFKNPDVKEEFLNSVQRT